MSKLTCPALILLMILTGCAPQPTPNARTEAPATPPEKSYSLVWRDEFAGPDGSAPDPDRWNYSTGGNGWGNGELQCYTDRIENAYIDGGMLVIEADKEEFMGCKYTSARINTLAKGEWKYGRFEFRAKLPTSQGIWPAFWLLPAEITRYGTWPSSGEIDIMELVGKEPGRVNGTLHFGHPHQWITGHYDLPDGAVFSEDFHVFSLEWTPEKITWFVDGKPFQTADQWSTSGEDYPFPAPFDVDFYLIMNVAVGGNFPGNPDATSVFPQRMFVDYVRVYQVNEQG